MYYSKLETAIKYDELGRYLTGEGTYIVREDPRDITSCHSFIANVREYNSYSLIHPEFHLKEKFENTCLDQLKNNCKPYDVYLWYSCIATQLRLEKRNECGFRIEPEKLQEMVDLLKDKLEFHKETINNYVEYEWSRYEDGLYGYLSRKIEELEVTLI